MEALKAFALEKMIVRKDHVLCTRCLEIEPIHPGGGTPAVSFIECHEANPECWLCSGTGSYPDDLPEFVVCKCVLANRAKAQSQEGRSDAKR